MKKYCVIKRWASVCLIGAFLLTGCAGAPPSNEGEKPEQAQEEEKKEEEWLPVILDEEMVESYVKYDEFGKNDKKAAIYSLYFFTTDKIPDYSEEADGNIVVEDIDETNAIAKIYYRDDSIDEVKITKDMDRGGSWIPLEYREAQPARLEEKFVIISYKDGNYYYDEAEWVSDFQEERIEELKALGVSDMGFENGYYVYNEKEELLPLPIDEETKLYVLDPSLTHFNKVEESEFRTGVEEGMFYGYHEIYMKDEKVVKIFQNYVP